MKTRNLTLPFCVSGFIHLGAFFLANYYLNFDIPFKKNAITIPVKFVLLGNQHNKNEIKKSNLNGLKKTVEKNNPHKPLIKTTLPADKAGKKHKDVDLRQIKTEGNEKTKLFVKKTPLPQPDDGMKIGQKKSIAPKIILKGKTLPEKSNVMGKLVKPETLLETTEKPDIEEKAVIEIGDRVKAISETISEGKNSSGIQTEIEKDSEMYDVPGFESDKPDIGHKMEADALGNTGKEKIADIEKEGAPGKPNKTGVMIEAITVNLKKPGYPGVSRKRNEEGKVILSVEVHENGEHENIKIISSSGYSRLDRAAIKSVEKATFVAARIEGKPVTSIKQIAFTYELE